MKSVIATMQTLFLSQFIALAHLDIKEKALIDNLTIITRNKIATSMYLQY